MKTNIEPKSKFNIKLLAGNNVALVEANGYDSEIFVPQIIHGRIALINIIPNRRCCHPRAARTKSAKCCGSNSKNHTNRNVIDQVISYRALGGQEEHKNAETITPIQPLACSTPINNNNQHHHQTGEKRHLKQRITPTKAILKQSNNENSPLTPETIREAALTTGLNGTILHLPNHSKTVKFSRTSSKKHIITHGTDNGEGDSGNGSGGGGNGNGSGSGVAESSPISTPLPSPKLPTVQTISLPKIRPKDNSPIKCTNGNKEDIENTKLNGNDVNNHGTLSPPLPFILKNNSSPELKWRKVITPVRTYLRKSITKKVLSPTVPTALEAAKAAKRLEAINRKFIPSHMINATQGKKGTHCIEVRKRKLIIDSKTILTPQKRNNLHHKTMATTTTTATKRYGGKQRQHASDKKKSETTSSFDLLTNSNRYQQRLISKELQRQFQKSCVNKAASTCESYKFLCANIPPLNEFHKN